MIDAKTPLHAVVVAAGSGRRFGEAMPKQYWLLQWQGHKQTVLQCSVAALAASHDIHRCTLVVAPDDVRAKTLDFALPVQWALGGETRWQSVFNGVKKIATNADNNDLLLIHDAARPCLQVQDLQKVIAAAYNEPYGAMLATPVSDTLKQQKPIAADSATIYSYRTVPRQGMWQAQTPQIYRLGALLTVLEGIAQRQNHLEAITDEAAGFEQLGWPIRLVQGSPSNIKLTYAEDLPLIEAILSHDARPAAGCW